MTHDRVQKPEFPLTHEFLAYMLGARRASVSIAVCALAKAGLINYTEAASMSSIESGYGVIEREYDRLSPSGQ
jgi:Crp-like helix-turn-helix protein